MKKNYLLLTPAAAVFHLASLGLFASTPVLNCYDLGRPAQAGSRSPDFTSSLASSENGLDQLARGNGVEETISKLSKRAAKQEIEEMFSTQGMALPRSIDFQRLAQLLEVVSPRFLVESKTEEVEGGRGTTKNKLDVLLSVAVTKHEFDEATSIDAAVGLVPRLVETH